MDATAQQIEQWARQHLQKFKVRGREASFCCVIHEDRNPSGSLNLDTGLWKCHGCPEKGNIFQLAMAVLHCDFKEAAAAVLGVNSFPPAGLRNLQMSAKRAEIVASYPYPDKDSVLLYEKVRLEPKGFYIRRPDGKGGYVNGLGDTPRVLFNLPLLARAGPEVPILVVEGEKDALAAASFGYLATCNPFGAREWQRSYSLTLKGKRVLVIPDNDEEGLIHSEMIRVDLEALSVPVRVAILPGPGKDLSDWVEAGGTAEQLREWVEGQFQKPEPSPEKKAPAAAPAIVFGTALADIPEIPDGAWCDLARDYRKALQESTEASDSFHLATYNAVAGGVLGRLVYFKNPKPIFMNQYVALVGKSSRSRKGTAMDFGEEIARAVNPELHWIRAINSAEGFVQTLVTLQEGQEQRKTIAAVLRFSELRSLIDVASRTGTQSIIPELSNAFDSPPTLERNVVKRSVAYGPVISVIGGAAPRWIDNIKIDDLEGGIGNRFMWVIGIPKKRRTFPKEARLNLVILDLGEVRKYWLGRGPTEISWTPEAEAIYDPWYQSLDRYHEYELFRILADRMEVHCPKTACLYAALDRRDKITVADIKAAILYCEFLIASLSCIFSDYGWTEGAKQDREIVDYVKQFHPGTVQKRRVQMRFARWGGDIFNKRLQWLTGEDGPLQSEKNGRMTMLFLNPEKV